jgi:hypothetical protein
MYLIYVALNNVISGTARNSEDEVFLEKIYMVFRFKRTKHHKCAELQLTVCARKCSCLKLKMNAFTFT